MNCVELGKSLIATLDMEQVLVIILRRLSELIDARNWTLYLYDPQRQALKFEVVVGLDKRMLSDVWIRPGEGIAGQALLSGELIRVPGNAQADTRFNRHIDALTGFHTDSVICVPLKAAGQVLGVLEVINPEDPALFEDAFLPILAILADFVAIAIVNARNYETKRRLTVTDDVTGHCNTRFLHEHLDRLMAEPATTSLVFLDLDNFKRVVDRHGHQSGSAMLREVAEAIGAGLEPQDRLVRYGGDEFVIILPGQPKDQARAKVALVREALGRTRFLRSEGLDIEISASFGIAGFPEDAADKKTLLRMADQALYRSKAQGKNRISLA
jgi:diguanylate cyclase (GGDEF)-like protein